MRDSMDLDESDWDELVDEMQTRPRAGAAIASDDTARMPDVTAIGRQVVDALSRESLPEILPEDDEPANQPPPPSVPRVPRRATTPPPPPSMSRPPGPAASTLAIATIASGSSAGGAAAAADQPLIDELRSRADACDRKADSLAASRARTELALVLEVVAGDRSAALGEYVRAHGTCPSLIAPILGARWLTPVRPVGPALALALDHLRVVRDDAARAERAVEVARLAQAAGSVDQALEHYQQALSLRPSHPSALRGLEGLLQLVSRRGDVESAEALARHLEQMASAWEKDSRLAAWLHVERAVLLDRIGRVDAARAALQCALRLDGRSPLVRRALTRHLSMHREHDALALAWAEEAGFESDPRRASRLEYAAGRILSERLDDARRALVLHERAAQRDGADVETRRAAWRELARLHEMLGAPKRSAEAWEQVLALTEDVAQRAYIHRRLSELFELIGQPARAALHGEQFLQSEPDDVEARERVDRALEALGEHERRVSFWSANAAREPTPAQRADSFVRAASIAERQVNNRALALSMYRAAWAADPSHVDAFDGLARLLARQTDPGAIPADVRSRIDLYEQAAVSTADVERRIACLETVAAIYEVELQMHDRALDVHRRILALDPSRRGALLGVQRTAARCRDYGELVAALVAEARLVTDPGLQRALLLRASAVASESMGDADRAVEIIGRILANSPGDLVALRATWRANYRSSRHEEALTQLRQLLKHSRRGAPSFSVCVEMALLLEDRLHRQADAVQAWREAHRQDPAHPVPPAEISRLLVASGQFRQAAEALQQMAEHASDMATRARLYAQAAEILDDRLDDPEAALVAWQLAHGNAPDDEGIFERLVRVLQRRGKPGDLVALLERRLAAAPGEARPALLFQLADLLVGERDYVRAAALLQEVIASDPDNVAAQRLLEQSLRRTESWKELALLLRNQAQRAAVPEVRAAALWEVRFLEEHHDVPPSETEDTLLAIQRTFPTNAFIHEALIRASGLVAADSKAASTLAASLSIASTNARDTSASAALDLASALVIERTAREMGAPAPIEAMQRYRACLTQWPDCLTAARGLLRVAHSLGDQLATIEAHAALGRIESDGAVRAEHCAVAADMMVAARTGDIQRAVSLYARALQENADLRRAASGLIGIVDLGADPGQVADVLRDTLERASSQIQVVAVGGALADIARSRLREPNVAVEALRRVRAKAPGHVPTLVALAEACNDVRLWPDAADAARAALAISQDAMERMRALLSLAEAHARQPDCAEDARREAMEAEAAADSLPGPERLPIIERLERVYELIGLATERERLTCMAVALGGDDPAPLGRLARLFHPDQVDSAIAYVQALHRVLAMADALGLAHRPAWLIEIGRLEAGVLARPREGLSRLRHAIALDPARLESTIALADALSVLGAHEEALSELREALARQPVSHLQPGALVAVILAIGRSLQATARTVQAQATEEILACFGYGAEDQIAALRARRPSDQALPHGCLARAVLERSVSPMVGRGVALRVALVLEDLIPKLLPADPTASRVPPGARIAARSAHPLRALADRLAQPFGELSFDLVVDVPALPIPGVAAGTPPLVMLPVGFDRLPGAEQAAGIARLLTLVALGVPWIDQVSAGDLDGLILGALHVGRPGWDAGGLPADRAQAASQWRPRIAKATSRKHRRALDDLAEEASLDLDVEAWRAAVRAATWRSAWLVSGDWIATFNHVWRTDPDLGRTWGNQVIPASLSHPVLRDLLLWTLSPEASAVARLASRTG